MRPTIIIAALLLLGGCQSGGKPWQPYRDLVGDSGNDTAPSQADTNSDAHCVSVAKQRALDARVNGYSLEMETAVYQGTYKDCAAWDAQHSE